MSEPQNRPILRNVSFSRTEEVNTNEPTQVKMSDNDTLKNNSSSANDSSFANSSGNSKNAVVFKQPSTESPPVSSNYSSEKPNNESESSTDTNDTNNKIPKSSSFHSSNSNSTSRSHTNSLSINKTKGSSSGLRKPSVASVGNTSANLYRNTTANRASMFSEYSGIIQHVDIDTIKYVGNKESLQVSQMSGLSSSSSDALVVLHSPGNSRKNSIDSTDSTKNPKASLNRLQSVDSVNMAKVLKSNIENSPVRKQLISSPPKSPLPKLNQNSVINPSVHSSPLKNKAHRRSRSNSSSSSRVNSRLDSIMKEVEDLKMEFEDDDPLSNVTRKSSKDPKAMSLSSTTTSFHTANDSVSSMEDEHFDGFELHPNENTNERNLATSDDDKTRNLNLNISTPPRKSRIMTLDPSAASTIRLKEPPLFLQGSSKDKENTEDELINMDRNLSTESLKTHTKTSSSNSNPSQHTYHARSSGSYKTKSSSSHKSKRKSTSSKSKIKPFSYETLAKLLNATDGIILGQEFATLSIPAEEKFLIERIVDSISRLTANMMLNPGRYDQSCARLERVLNVLEGFD